MPNYVTNVVGDPYVRIDRITIDYSKPLEAFIQARERTAILLVDDSIVMQPGEHTLSINIGPQNFADVIQLVDPTTGADMPGATMTVQTLMVGITSFLRKYQRLRDTPPEP